MDGLKSRSTVIRGRKGLCRNTTVEYISALSGNPAYFNQNTSIQIPFRNLTETCFCTVLRYKLLSIQ